MSRFVKVATPMVGEEEIAAVREVILSGRFSSGPRVSEFEARFARWVGVEHARAVNSGTAALHAALACMDVGPGDEVIVPPLTFMSTVTSVLHQNAIPVFADIDPVSFCLRPEAVEAAVTKRTKAVIPVHLFGNACDMDGLAEVAARHGLRIIEDCAQAHGTSIDARRVGGLGDAGAFSFYATKHMTTGEGGMVTTNDAGLAERIERFRSHGMASRDEHVMLGYNYRMNEIAAAIGLVQLDKIDAMNEARISNSKTILERLSEVQDAWFEVPKLDPRIGHTFFWCPVVVKEGYDAKETAARLRERGVEVRRRYTEPLYRQQLLLDRSPYPGGCPFSCTANPGPDYASLRLPVAEQVAGRLLGLPNHPGLTPEDIDFVCETVVEAWS